MKATFLFRLFVFLFLCACFSLVWGGAAWVMGWILFLLGVFRWSALPWIAMAGIIFGGLLTMIANTDDGLAL